MAQSTTTYGKVTRPELDGGGRLIEQIGYAKFVKKNKTVSISVPMIKTVRYLNLTWRANATSFKPSGVPLSCSGTVASNRLVVTRTTAAKHSGGMFWYQIIGY